MGLYLVNPVGVSNCSTCREYCLGPLRRQFRIELTGFINITDWDNLLAFPPILSTSSHSDPLPFVCFTNFTVVMFTFCYMRKVQSWLLVISFYAFHCNQFRVFTWIFRTAGTISLHFLTLPVLNICKCKIQLSKCNLKPGKEAIRLQRKTLLSSSYILFHFANSCRIWCYSYVIRPADRLF